MVGSLSVLFRLSSIARVATEDLSTGAVGKPVDKRW
jgi:hypothetical protein